MNNPLPSDSLSCQSLDDNTRRRSTVELVCESSVWKLCHPVADCVKLFRSHSGTNAFVPTRAAIRGAPSMLMFLHCGDTSAAPRCSYQWSDTSWQRCRSKIFPERPCCGPCPGMRWWACC
ncbi:unnamed protein product [Pleuronectes platessa]|uniref:Uncharacterized protein n=1 Tax=Pleuronectes platessa TaxID=8262 RepID=A0A9N7YUC8_PLEPL|nr:unnamed protein product [Pleuronectes platessa]